MKELKWLIIEIISTLPVVVVCALCYWFQDYTSAFFLQGEYDGLLFIISLILAVGSLGARDFLLAILLDLTGQHERADGLMAYAFGIIIKN